MTEERIAYVVTFGSYSDYGIAAVFDNLAAAKAYAGGWARIEQYTLNSTTPRKQTFWRVRVGDQVQANPEVQDDTDDWVRTKQTENIAWCVQAWGYQARAVHPDKDTAYKIAHDLLAQLRYEHQTNGITHLPVEDM